MEYQPVSCAIIQDSPVYMNLPASIQKATGLIRQAAEKGARIVVFPESWLPGYPLWLDDAPKAGLWDYAPAKAIYNILYRNSIEVNDASVAKLADCAGAAGCYVVMGAHERYGATLYNTILYFSDNGELAGIHRKLVPTYTERMIWGCGDGSTLTTLETPYGRLGGLICWEHWMPLARAAMHARGEIFHAAQWPWVKEMNRIASQHYAFEGGCYVLAAGSVLQRDELLSGIDKDDPDCEAAMELLGNIPGEDQSYLQHGGSCIISPDGAVIAEAQPGRAEILMAELDPRKVIDSHYYLDTVGHYARPDVFQLIVNQDPQKTVRFADDLTFREERGED